MVKASKLSARLLLVALTLMCVISDIVFFLNLIPALSQSCRFSWNYSVIKKFIAKYVGPFTH